MAEIQGTEVLENESQTLRRCCFANVRLPLDLSRIGVVDDSAGLIIAKWMQEKLPEEYKTYIPTKFYAGAFWSRISAQIYLTLEDSEWRRGRCLNCVGGSKGENGEVIELHLPRVDSGFEV